jgi:hypothetical protein
MPQNARMPDVTLSVPRYDPGRGVVIRLEGGDVLVRHGESGKSGGGLATGRAWAATCVLRADQARYGVAGSRGLSCCCYERVALLLFAPR